MGEEVEKIIKKYNSRPKQNSIFYFQIYGRVGHEIYSLWGASVVQ